jgi:hypothetical protein
VGVLARPSRWRSVRDLAGILELSKGHALGGLTIKNLINEGRP